MEQLPLTTRTLEVWFRKHRAYNSKIKRTTMAMTLYVGDEDAVIHIEWNGCGRRPSEQDFRKRLMEAWKLRSTRPFGDEYCTPDGYVSYLYERVL